MDVKYLKKKLKGLTVEEKLAKLAELEEKRLLEYWRAEGLKAYRDSQQVGELFSSTQLSKYWESPEGCSS